MTPFEEGVTHFKSGKVTNPYREGTTKYRSWQHGFDTAYFTNKEKVIEEESSRSVAALE